MYFFIHCHSDEEAKEVIKPPQPKVKQTRKERYTWSKLINLLNPNKLLLQLVNETSPPKMNAMSFAFYFLSLKESLGICTNSKYYYVIVTVSWAIVCCDYFLYFVIFVSSA